MTMDVAAGVVYGAALLGISLLSEGILNLCVAVSTVKIVKHQYPDVIDADSIPIDREDSNE